MKIRYTLIPLVLFVLIAASNLTRRTSAQATPKEIDIVARRFEYQPSELTLKKDQPVIIHFKSIDVTHGLKFEDLNISATIDKGSSVPVSFTPTQVGDFVGHCSVFCGPDHGSMALTFHVVE
ncbi:MAG: cytochrome c oxidase subunit [Acidobacteriaceae bacterium]|nr:cytochrome c oxidase subunit [Acidobacteriaceae bacterium]